MNRFFILVLFLTGFIATGQPDDLRKKNYNLKKDIALDGYDPTTFFTKELQEGDEKISHTYKGVRYQFVNAANQAKFKATPDKYEPAYGGWCAYAMGATGEKVKVDIETYKIIDGKVYLFYNFWGTNTLKDWNVNEKQLKGKADLNWKKIEP